jgi:glycosyltransferase involved in cell wall biosynthesis
VHNAESTIGEQLEALVDQIDAPAFEVVIVLNCCTDGTARIAGGYAPRLRLRVVEANSRPSAACARNDGAANSSAPILLFCDADDRVDQGWVRQLSAPLRSRRTDFAGGKIVVDQNGLPGWLYRWRYQALDGVCLHSGPGGL